MQQHEIIYDTIIEDLARAGKILNPENLTIMYFNIFLDIYSSLIQSMESVLAILISQSIKAKIQEKKHLKNVVNNNNEQASNSNNIIINIIKSQKKKKIKIE